MILVIDGHNQIHRANIKFKNQEENDFIIVYNFFRSFRVLIEKFKPDIVYFVLEGKPQFRYDLLSSYKENRIIKNASKSKEESERFHSQKNIIIDLLKKLPIRIIKAANYECDDVIAYIARTSPDEDVTIISNDTDYIQLLQEGISCKIYNPIKKEYVQAPSYHYLAYKCLTGDVSDNIPRIISDGKAKKLVNDPTLFQQFLSVKENEEKFNLNKSLIQFPHLNDEDINYLDGETNFEYIKNEFEKMKFDSITNDESWSRFINTFNDLV